MAPIGPLSQSVYKRVYTYALEIVMNTVRWNIAAPLDVDQSVRMFLAAQGGGCTGDLSGFVEEAARAYLLDRAVDQAKAAVAASGVSETELAGLIDEAVQSVRER
jgi:hypothetical protein